MDEEGGYNTSAVVRNWSGRHAITGTFHYKTIMYTAVKKKKIQLEKHWPNQQQKGSKTWGLWQWLDGPEQFIYGERSSHLVPMDWRGLFQHSKRLEELRQVDFRVAAESQDTVHHPLQLLIHISLLVPVLKLLCRQNTTEYFKMNANATAGLTVNGLKIEVYWMKHWSWKAEITAHLISATLFSHSMQTYVFNPDLDIDCVLEEKDK